MKIVSMSKPGGRRRRVSGNLPIKVHERDFGVIKELNKNDVLLGRGGRVKSWKGNVQYRQIISSTRKEYLAAKKLEKGPIALRIVEQIRNMDPPGRFLAEEDDGGPYYEIGDEKAIGKVSQALRERAPEIREEMGQNKRSPVDAVEKKKNPFVKAIIQASSSVVSMGSKSNRLGTSGRGGKIKVLNKSSFTPMTLPPGPIAEHLRAQQSPRVSAEPSSSKMGKSSRTEMVSESASKNKVPTSKNEVPTMEIAFGQTFYTHKNKEGSEISGISNLTSNHGSSMLSGISNVSSLTAGTAAGIRMLEQQHFHQHMSPPSNKIGANCRNNMSNQMKFSATTENIKSDLHRSNNTFEQEHQQRQRNNAVEQQHREVLLAGISANNLCYPRAVPRRADLIRSYSDPSMVGLAREYMSITNDDITVGTNTSNMLSTCSLRSMKPTVSKSGMQDTDIGDATSIFSATTMSNKSGRYSNASMSQISAGYGLMSITSQNNSVHSGEWSATSMSHISNGFGLMSITSQDSVSIRSL